MPPAIDVRELCKHYGPVRAVDRISFSVEPGELVGFLGNNGAGKSTTMRVLTTYMPASSGLASVAGFDVMYESDEVRRRLGYLPENVPLYPEMRVDEYLAYRAKLKGVDRDVRMNRIETSLERCRIREVRRRLIGTLSKGYRQRVGLADTLLAAPEVLILDEPLSGLDPVQQEETLASIRDLGGQHTVLFSSHHLPDVEKICDRVIIINRGTIKFDGRLSEIRAKLPTILIETKGPAAVIEAALQTLPGLASVNIISLDDGYTRAELKPEPGTDPREAAARLLIDRGHMVRRVEQRFERLEDIYMRTSVRGE